MQIFVKNLLGRNITIYIEPSDSIRILKDMYEDKLGVHPDNQRIRFLGKPINQDDYTIEDCFIENESTIHILHKYSNELIEVEINKISEIISQDKPIKFVKANLMYTSIPLKMRELYFKETKLDNKKPFYYYQDCRYHCCGCAHDKLKLTLVSKKEKIAYNHLTYDSTFLRKANCNENINILSPVIVDNSKKSEILNECYKNINEIENKINETLSNSKDLIKMITLETNKIVNQMREAINYYINMIKIASSDIKVKVFGDVSQEQRFILLQLSQLESSISLNQNLFDKFEVNLKKKNPELNFKEYFDKQITSNLITFVKDKKIKCFNIKTFKKFTFNNTISTDSLLDIGMCSLPDLSIFWCSKAKYYLFFPNQKHILQITPAITPRSSIGICSYLNGFIYTFGGITDSGFSDNCEAYNIEKDRWTALTSLEIKISHSSTTVISESIYVCGYGSNKVYKFDPIQNIFKKILHFGDNDHKIVYSVQSTLYIICNEKFIEYETKSENRVREPMDYKLDRSLYLLSSIVNRKKWIYFLLSDKFVYRIKIYNEGKNVDGKRIDNYRKFEQLMKF